MRIAELPTPCLLLDRAKLEANLTGMTERLRRHGVALRPHLKTAKSIDVARLALAANFGGIAVSTLNEASYFFSQGIRDITYAVGLAPAKMDQVFALHTAGADIGVIVDNAVAARAAAEAAPHSLGLKVLIEVDTGGGRGGVAPTSEELLEIGAKLDGAPGLELQGLLTHAGQAYDCRSIAAIAAVAEEQAGIGVCRLDDIAISVLTSVIGQRQSDNRVFIDASGALMRGRWRCRWTARPRPWRAPTPATAWSATSAGVRSTASRSRR